jgi:hypothetical protein
MMATTELTYKGRRIWIDPYRGVAGWQVNTEIWETREEGVVKEEIRLPANWYLRSLRRASRFAERMAKRGIDRREE